MIVGRLKFGSGEDAYEAVLEDGTWRCPWGPTERVLNSVFPPKASPDEGVEGLEQIREAAEVLSAVAIFEPLPPSPKGLVY